MLARFLRSLWFLLLAFRLETAPTPKRIGSSFIQVPYNIIAKPQPQDRVAAPLALPLLASHPLPLRDDGQSPRPGTPWFSMW